MTSNPKTLEELQMDTRPPTWRNHRDSFQTAGDLRSAATDLCMALKGTPHHDLAAQIHDSLVMALPRGSHVPIGRAALSGDSSSPETSVPLSLVKEARLYMQHDRKCWGSTHEDDCDCGFVKIAEKLKPFINGSPVETTDTHPLPCPMCKQRHAPWCPGKSPENTTACRCPGPLRAPFCPVHGDQALPVRQLGPNAAPVLGAEASGDRQASQKASDERVCQCATYCMANAGMKWDPPVKCRGLTGPDPGAQGRFK